MIMLVPISETRAPKVGPYKTIRKKHRSKRVKHKERVASFFALANDPKKWMRR
jgi:putative ubiquitin-RnfH superfamily antitoxin RatB of RatAB toxin-antitoxin module